MSNGLFFRHIVQGDLLTTALNYTTMIDREKENVKGKTIGRTQIRTERL
jgi:hypothetical protein